MNTRRAVSAVVLSFLVSQILAAMVHGYILAADYEPFEGTLLRAVGENQPPWQMLFLPVVHLAFVTSLVWVYGRLRLEGSLLARGLTLGLVGWLMGQVPLWLLWYAQQPWPGALVVKQLGLELISKLAIGVVIAAVAHSGVKAHAGAEAPALRKTPQVERTL
jgi:hypothetical protein